MRFAWLILDQVRLQMPKTVKPNETRIRVSILATRNPTSGMAKIAPMPRGATANPEAVAEYPNRF